MKDIIVTLLKEKTLVNGRTDNFGAPLHLGDKVIAIESNGDQYLSYYVGTTPSGITDKVLSVGGKGNYFRRPYRGVIRYEWVLSGNAYTKNSDSIVQIEKVLKDFEALLP